MLNLISMLFSQCRLLSAFVKGRKGQEYALSPIVWIALGLLLAFTMFALYIIMGGKLPDPFPD